MTTWTPCEPTLLWDRLIHFLKTILHHFTPERSDCPVPMNRLNGARVTHRDFGKGNVEVTEEVNCNQRKDPNQRSKEHWQGKTVFQMELPVPSMTSRLAKTKPEPPKTELRLDTDGRTKKANDLKRSRDVPNQATRDGIKMVSNWNRSGDAITLRRSHC